MSASFAKTFGDGPTLPAADSPELRKALFVSPAEPRSPWIVQVAPEDRRGETYGILAPVGAALRLVDGIASGIPASRCGSEIFSVSVEHGPIARVTVERRLSVPEMLCDVPGREPRECTGAAGEVPLQSFCKPMDATIVDHVFDPARGVVATVTQPAEWRPPADPRRRVTVRVKGARLLVSGGGCALDLPL